MQTIEITWDEVKYTLQPNFELFMKIEERVSFHRIAQGMRKALLGRDPTDIPVSHLAWTFFCCLQAAGAPVRDPMAVQEALFDNSMGEFRSLLQHLTIVYYGATPQKVPKKKQQGVAAEASSSSASRKISKKDTE